MIPNWLYISNTSGSSGTTTITVSAGTNTNFYENAVILLVSNISEDEESFVVIQEARKSNFEVSPSAITASYSGGSEYIFINSSSSWTATYPSWISGATSGSGSDAIEITIGYNSGSTSRTGDIVFTSNGNSKIVKVTQDMFVIQFIVSPSAVTASYSGGTFNISLTSNTDWVFYYGESQMPYITTSYNQGQVYNAGIHNITVNVSENYKHYFIQKGIQFYTSDDETMLGIVWINQEAASESYENQYLSFIIQSAGTIEMSTPGYYNMNNSGWTSFTGTNANHSSINVNVGDVIKWKRNDGSTYGMFNGTAKYNVFGNIMSILYGDNFTGQTTANYLGDTFRGCNVVDASCLVLPATTVGSSSYGYAYWRMFMDCKYLTAAPATLPATTLNSCCYWSMFEGCERLTSAPSLPATVLKSSCYREMFAGCVRLTTAPDLPASTLVDYCYDSMFDGCSSLNYIKCLATDISASYCTYSWVNGVASSGTFVKKSSMSGWGSGNNGIPNNWTITDAT